MLSYFFWGTVILLVATLLFYTVFAALIYYWREVRVSVAVVPMLFAFEFFLAAFLIMSATVMVLQYWSEISALLQ